MCQALSCFTVVNKTDNIPILREFTFQLVETINKYVAKLEKHHLLASAMYHVEGTQGFLPQWEKELESPTSTCLEARICFHGSIEMTRTPSPRTWRPDFPGAIREAP